MQDAPPVVPPTAPAPLERIPYPPFVRLLALVTAVTFVLALARVPRAIGSGIDAERGRRDLGNGRFTEARRLLGRVVHAYPAAKDARIDLAEACLKSDDLPGLADAVGWFEGKEISKEQSERLDAIVAQADHAAKGLEAP